MGHILSGWQYVVTGALRSDIQTIISLLNEVLKKMTDNQAQLDSAIQQETTALQSLQAQQQANSQALAAAVKQITTDLQALLAKTPPTADFTAEVASINSQLAAISTIASAEQGTVTGATGQVQTDDQSIQNVLNPPPPPAPAGP
jgi:seryl-tRNA synthetase